MYGAMWDSPFNLRVSAFSKVCIVIRERKRLPFFKQMSEILILFLEEIKITIIIAATIYYLVPAHVLSTLYILSLHNYPHFENENETEKVDLPTS